MGPDLIRFNSHNHGLTLSREDSETPGTSPSSSCTASETVPVDVNAGRYRDDYIDRYRHLVHARVYHENLDDPVLIRGNLVLDGPEPGSRVLPESRTI